MHNLRRALPSVDICLQHLTAQLPAVPRPLLRHSVNQFLEQCRADINNANITSAASLQLEVLLPRLQAFVVSQTRPRLREVINGTGVIIHTNMGRSVLADSAVQAVRMAAENYSSLELDLATGGRGSRHNLVSELICQLTGAEDALVVNNNAAAVLLILDSLCAGGEVIVSRGQLVEIGGSFRIPDIMQKSGVRLREVGTTNRTHLHDYAQAITEQTVALLRVHTSNYRIIGFHKDVALEELAMLARRHNLPVIEDLGSGNLVDFSPYGLMAEPTVQAVLHAGADIVSFSGDKVLGGPQAGIIAGRRHLLERIRTNQLLRALRTDKLTLAALEATLRLYLDQTQAVQKVPTLHMITTDAKTLRQRAQRLQRRINTALKDILHTTLRADSSRVGGGAFPEQHLPTTLVCIHPHDGTAQQLRQRLCNTDPPLLGRLEDDAFCLDVRTIPDKKFTTVVQLLQDVCMSSCHT